MNNYSCVIPFYNEGNRIIAVLDELVKVKAIGEIICIDDGSTDQTAELIKRTYPDIKVISLAANTGKTEAVRQGAEAAQGAYILLLDADLRNLNSSEIEAAIAAMQKDNAIDMLVLRRINAPWNIKLFRGDVLIPGERLLKTTDLLEAIRTERPARYQLEFALNKYMMSRHKKVYWMPSSALNTWPTTKLGFVRGLGKIISMQMNILSYVGFGNYVKQLLFFCRKRLA